MFAFYSKLDPDLVHQVEYICSVNVYLQLFVVPTNTGVEVFALVLMDTIKLMDNVPLFNQLMFVLLTLSQMESIVFANKVITQSYQDHVINAHQVPTGMVKLAAMETMEIIMGPVSANSAGYGIQLKLAAIILEVVEETSNLMEQTVDVNKVSI